MSCQTAADLISQATDVLGECALSERYSKQTILNQFNMSLSALAEARPDAFKSTIEIPLVAGVFQQLPKGVTFLVQVLDTAYKDESGVAKPCVSKPLVADDTYISKFGAWGKCVSTEPAVVAGAVADPCESFKASSFSYQKKLGNFFQVTPAAPVGTKAIVMASVYKHPEKVLLKDIDTYEVCDYVNIIFARMMANLLMLDSADDSLIKKHQLYNQQWLDFVRINYRSAARVGSGYYLGEVGTGDPAVIRPAGTT